MFLQLAGLSLLLAVQVFAEQPYMLIIPKDVRIGMKYSADLVLIDTVTNDVTATVTVRDGTDPAAAFAWTNSQMTINIAAGGKSGNKSINVPFSLPAGQTYYVHVQFTGMTVKTTPVEVASQRIKSGLFVQTDKPIYKPGDKVRTRALAVDKDLKPVRETITMKIKDPASNILIQKTSGDPNSVEFMSLMSEDFELSDEAPVGDYVIEIFTDTVYTKETFKVETYVIPKFEVIITLDKSYGVSGADNYVTGHVSAVYSYGQMVTGELSLKTDGVKVDLEDSKIDGRKQFRIPVAADSNEIYFRGFYDFSKTMTIEATVTEKHTNNDMSDSVTFTLYRTEFISTVVEPVPKHYVGAKTFSFQVKLTNPSGGPVPDWDSERPNSNALEHYSLVYSYLGREENITDITENPVNVTVEMGENEKFPHIEVWFEYGKGSSKVSSARTKVNIETYFSSEGPPPEVMLTVQNETHCCFQLKPFVTGEIAYYQILDNYAARKVLPYTQQGGHCFEVERHHSPKSMIVAYKVSSVTPADQKEQVQDLNTANLVVDIPWTTQQQVNVEVSPELVKPGGSVTININTVGSSLVALTGIDKSLTFLADAIDITESKMKDTVEGYQMFSEQEVAVPNPRWDIMPMRAVARRKKRCIACWNDNGYLDAMKLLEESGLQAITNLYIARDESNDRGGPPMFFDDVLMMAAVPDMEEKESQGAEAKEEAMPANAPNKNKQTQQKVRKDFREVWLWSVETTPSSGSLTLEKTVPDVITNWMISAYAFNNMYGAGVAKMQEVTVFQDFFLSMNLPYSVVRGEVFSLELLVSNYKSDDVQVQIELDVSNNYTIMDLTKQSQTIMIGSMSSGIVKVPVQLKTLGKPLIKATARQIGGSGMIDKVERELFVKAEGRELMRDVSAKMSITNSWNDNEMDLSSFFQESNIVPDSLRMMLYVTGDMMGPVIASIGSKIRMPSGCGEQNIQSLTPGLFGALYLKTINRLERELVEKVSRVCGTGYRKELNYKHPDGSYSAFGAGPGLCQCGAQGQKKGSTWLTAYVLKMFSLLYTNEMTYVDFEILREAFEFLSTISKPDCDDQYFVEEGQLIHTEMQGGSSSRFGFTAFVLVSVLDFKDAAIKAQNQELIQNASTLIQGATEWLDNHIEKLIATRQSYQLSIVAYALSKAGGHSDTAAKLLREVKSILAPSTDTQPPGKSECTAKPSDTEYNFCTKESDCNSNEGRFSYYGRQECCKIPCGKGKMACTRVPSTYYRQNSGSTKIETYGYTLMAALHLYMEDDSLRDLADEMKDTLLGKRDADGFFESTQDTAVGLEALTRYSIAFPGTVGASFSIRGKWNNELSEVVVFSPDNYTVRAEIELPVTEQPNKVSVEAKGAYGTAFINLVALYNVKSNVTGKPLILDLEPGVTKDGEPVIKQCVRKNPESDISLGTMIVAKLILPSGANFDTTKPLTDPLTSPSKIETEDGVVTTYYMNEEKGFVDWRCLEIVYKQEFVIDNVQPSVGTVMDYYDAKTTVDVLYMPDQEGKRCLGCPTTGASTARGSTGVMVLMSVCLIFITYIQNL